MKKFFSYFRVSSKEQEEGASLEAQQQANQRYAQAQGLVIAEEFREVQSASKGPRKQFELMTKKLNKDVAGIIFHDVDRSTRSIADLAKIHELLEKGYEIHFSRENRCVSSGNDRLMMNIKGVFAANYVDNLKQEVKKGMYHRLSEGYCVIGQAVLGYLAKGKGVREPDPITAPLITECFELYASGRYSLEMLAELMYKKGLRTRSGKKVRKEKMSVLLNNKFYIGLMTVKGQIFEGKHPVLVSVNLFNKVQKILRRRSSPKIVKNSYKFSHLFTCGVCGRALRTSSAKNKYHYYSCRHKNCLMEKTIPEDVAERQILHELRKIKFSDLEVKQMSEIVKTTRQSMVVSIAERKKSLALQIANIEAHVSRLIDMQFQNPLPEDMFITKKNDLLIQLQSLRSELNNCTANDGSELDALGELIKLLADPVYAYEQANDFNKGRLVSKIMTNISFTKDQFLFEWQTPFGLLAKRG